MIELSISHPLKHFAFSADLQFEAKGAISIFGKSGCGKTTLLNFIAGKQKPKKGRIIVREHTLLDTEKRINLPPHKRNIGYVFQEATLFPHYSVMGNLKYGMKQKEMGKIEAIADLLDISHLLNERVAHLSGGEKQRIAIGRALLREPQILLMDEPLAALDAVRKEEILQYLERIIDSTGIPILYVTHNAKEAHRLSTQFIHVVDGIAALKPIKELPIPAV